MGKWYRFWSPESGFIGGMIYGLIPLIVYRITGSEAIFVSMLVTFIFCVPVIMVEHLRNN